MEIGERAARIHAMHVGAQGLGGHTPPHDWRTCPQRTCWTLRRDLGMPQICRCSDDGKKLVGRHTRALLAPFGLGKV